MLKVQILIEPFLAQYQTLLVFIRNQQEKELIIQIIKIGLQILFQFQFMLMLYNIKIVFVFFKFDTNFDMFK